MQILVPFSNDTRRVEIFKAKIDFELDLYRRLLADSKDELRAYYEAQIKDLELAESEYIEGPENPAVLIGYVPAAKLSELKHRSNDAARKGALDNPQLEAILSGDEVCREFVRWGVRGHENFPVPYEGDVAKHAGVDHPVASSMMVELYEANGWLYVLKKLILEYNSLTDEKKRPS